MDDSLKHLADKIEKGGSKVVFGLQPKDFEIINRHLAKFDNAKYSYEIWKDIGKEMHWDALTAALYYFQSQSPSVSVSGIIEKWESRRKDIETRKGNSDYEVCCIVIDDVLTDLKNISNK